MTAWMGIGLMSGTSLDGVDACAVRIERNNEHTLLGAPHSISATIINTHSIDIPTTLRHDLLELQTHASVPLKTLLELDKSLAQWYGTVVTQLMAQTPHLKPSDINAIGCHGQTVAHHPSIGTLQLGDPNILAELTGISVISHFRQADMAAGGQGAPLVPFADALLFSDAKDTRGLLNIGGIANITLLPQLTNTSKVSPVWEHSISAYDMGPGNMLIDAAAQHFYQQPYDAEGQRARQGTIQADLLTHISNLDAFAKKTPPKSTGRDDYGHDFFQACLAFEPKNRLTLRPEDWLATFTEYTALCIGNMTDPLNPHPSHRHSTSTFPIDQLWISGGGALNPYLLERIQHHLPTVKTIEAIPHHMCPPQYKEAFCFAILAWAYQHHLPSNIMSVTGAYKPCRLGRQSFY